MLHQPGVTERLATFVTATRWSDLPKEVAHAAKRSLLNFFAVALTGCRNETFEIALKTLERILRRPAGDPDRAARAHRRVERGVSQCRRG